ncbi:MAG: hypothetical protein UGF45_14140 [Massilioclostridium sp.]|nr:hypothetical protein [Massilioclostridium sp.]
MAVDEADLPSEIINLADYYPMAKEISKQLFPDWKSFDQSKKALLDSFVVYKTAELLFPYCSVSIYNVKTEQTTHSKAEKFSNGSDYILDNIKNKLNSLCAELNEQTDTVFFGFDISGRRR